MKKIYIVPQVEEMPMKAMGGIMKTSTNTPSGAGGAPARHPGDFIE